MWAWGHTCPRSTSSVVHHSNHRPSLFGVTVLAAKRSARRGQAPPCAPDSTVGRLLQSLLMVAPTNGTRTAAFLLPPMQPWAVMVVRWGLVAWMMRLRGSVRLGLFFSLVGPCVQKLCVPVLSNNQHGTCTPPMCPPPLP